jgi:predicted nucleotidyltransferase component of viral defense system
MLELKQITSFFPESLRHLKRNLLREYLQYKILDAVFRSRLGQKLVFMGGTAIHIVHGLPRFSEDLDFDNRDLKRAEFSALVRDVARKLALEGYAVETGTSFKGAFSADIKFMELLFNMGLSGHKEEKFLIKLDAEPQQFLYEPERVIISKFDVVAGISVVPASILLAQKYHAILTRKRALGRDFFDCLFLAGKARPDFGYLQERAGIADQQALKSVLLTRCAELDFKLLLRDMEPFLYKPADARQVLLFEEFVRKW